MLADGGKVRVVLDLSRIARMRPSGAVLLLAEVDRALAKPGGAKRITVRRPQNDVVDQVMQQIGIYERLGIACSTAPSDESVVHWRAATGVISDGVTGGTILLNYDGRLADGLTRGLYDGVVEAMTNTVQHAYDGSIGSRLKHGLGRRWWMLSHERDNLLTVAICDLGIGIPRSLPRSKTFALSDVKTLWRKLGLNTSDASAIEVAIRLGETRTGQKGRGKGLAEIVEAVNLSDSGGVFISSNRGVLSCAPGKRHVTRNTPHSIHGTLIHWSVPISGETDGEN